MYCLSRTPRKPEAFLLAVNVASDYTTRRPVLRRLWLPVSPRLVKKSKLQTASRTEGTKKGTQCSIELPIAE
jgi:hypothetical protein